MAKYLIKQGDRIDIICQKFYGKYRNGYAEQVMNANAWLRDYDDELPVGKVLNLPKIEVAEKSSKTLW